MMDSVCMIAQELDMKKDHDCQFNTRVTRVIWLPLLCVFSKPGFLFSVQSITLVGFVFGLPHLELGEGGIL